MVMYTEDGMKPHILVIEDNKHLAESLVDVLSVGGYETHVCGSGREGLDYALQNQPHLIILDIMLPDMSGYNVFHKLRETDWGKTAKIIVLTASESIDNIAKNINLPKELVLFKPEVSVETLLTKVASILK
jgi:two-component system, OmpR family, response regulator